MPYRFEGNIEASAPEAGLGSNDPRAHHPSSIDRPICHPSWADLTSPSGYKVKDKMINEIPDRPFHVIIIGAGAAGIDFIHHAKAVLPALNVTFHCYEKNADVGGTWYENRYPGCACDVPSVNYQFAWRQNPNWTSYYSGSDEIWRYMKGCVEAEGMSKWITLNTEVKEARWDEQSGRWKVILVTRSGDEAKEWVEECDVLLNGTGFLNAWKWPEITGLHDFKGKLFHTARYDTTYDLKGKRVAVIGSGSSGVQTVASIYKDVDKLYHWIRTPTWITAGFAQKYAGKNGKNFDYTEAQKEEWKQNPDKMRKYSKMIENELNQRFKFILRNSAEAVEANSFAYEEMRTKLDNDARLMDTIIPKDFNVGCRRPTPGNGYLEALVGPKTTCYTTPINTITENGFLDADGNEVEIDVMICATGFDTSFRPRFPIIGLDSIPVAEKWKTYPMAYAAVAIPEVPNYFMFSGPFTPVAQGSLLPLITLLSRHFLQIIRKMRTEDIKRLSPKLGPTKDFSEHAQLFLKRTAWSDPCTSWFKQGTRDGPVVMWPGTRLAFFEIMKTPRYEDYEIEYWSGNRWGWMGNGFVKEEFMGMDTTYYLDEDWLESFKSDGIGMRKEWVQPEAEIDGKLGLREREEVDGSLLQKGACTV